MRARYPEQRTTGSSVGPARLVEGRMGTLRKVPLTLGRRIPII
jgi:hypothetical protein